MIEQSELAITDIASWTSKGNRLQNRKYSNVNETDIGRNLPAYNRVQALLQNLKSDKLREILTTVQLFTGLPKKFYEKLINCLANENKNVFPGMSTNKKITIADCIKKMSPEKQSLLSVDKWLELGWQSKADYQQWLNTYCLFAFASSGHYCSVPRVFDYHGKQGSVDYFGLEPEATTKKTNILSIAGFEFRGIDGAIFNDTNLPNQLENYASQMMRQIIYAANTTCSTDIVMIPVGMGVFLTSEVARISPKEKILQGWINALQEYKGEPIKFHCCLMPGQFQAIVNQVKNQYITFVDRTGSDAYVVANAIQDDAQKSRKSMLVNAGDSDWISLLDNKRGPGQCAMNHTLFNTTSDEYFALMTLFSAASIQNVVKQKIPLTIHSSFSALIEPEKKLDNIKNLVTQLLQICAEYIQHLNSAKLDDDLAKNKKNLVESASQGLKQSYESAMQQLKAKNFCNPEEFRVTFSELEKAVGVFKAILNAENSKNLLIESRDTAWTRFFKRIAVILMSLFYGWQASHNSFFGPKSTTGYAQLEYINQKIRSFGY